MLFYRIKYTLGICAGSILMFLQTVASDRVGLAVSDYDDIRIIEDFSISKGPTKIMAEQQQPDATINEPVDCYEFGDEAEEMELFRLRNMKPVEIPIKSMPLFAAIKLCTESAGMNYLAPDKEDFFDIISLNVHSTAFELLELLAETYCFRMDYRSGIWRFYRININELITRGYKLKYNTNELVTTNSPSIKPGLGKSSQGTSAFSDKGVFEKKKHELTELVQKILDIPSTDLSAKIDSRIDVDAISKLMDPNFTPKLSKKHPSIKGNFYFSSDNNELTVTATRQQHSLIEAYLKAIDKPQKLIKIESMIVETNKNPKCDFGIDWSKAGKTTLEIQNIRNSQNKITELAKSYFMPDIATLSVKDMSVALNFLQSDNESTILQDPVVVTSNNREVSLKSVTQQPIETGNSSSTTATSNNTSNSIEYIEIGTLINIYPKILEGGIEGYSKEAVKMDISIVISTQIGTQEIDGNNFPVVSFRTYTYSVVVPSGYTLAIGGLSECTQSTNQNKLPIFGDIPVVGCLFRSKCNNKDKRNLLAFITPTIIDITSSDDLMRLKKSRKPTSFDQLAKVHTKLCP